MKNNKKAFTLAETIIVVVVLGLVAAITVPAVVKRHAEMEKRMKIKKNMTVYDHAINKMVIENGIKDETSLIKFAGDESNNCKISTTYFNKTDGDGCVFKASDGVWWDIKDITKPILAFSEDDLNGEPNIPKSFGFYAWFDSNNSLRVDDLEASTGDTKTQLKMLYSFVNNKKSSNNIYTDEQYENEVSNLSNYFIYDCYVDNRENECLKYGYDKNNGITTYNIMDSQGKVFLKMTANKNTSCSSFAQSIFTGECNLYNMNQVEVIQKDGTYKTISKYDDDCTNWNMLCDSWSWSNAKSKSCKKKCVNNAL